MKDFTKQKTRDELKKYFGAGQKPTSEDFADLIDSMVNIVDDHIAGKLELATEQENDAAIEFKKRVIDKQPVWKIAMDKNECLIIRGGQDDTKILTLHPDKKIELGAGNDVIVSGSLCANSLLGRAAGSGKFVADGQWHDLIAGSKGPKAYEIIAGCETFNNYNFALTKVVATQFDNSPIRVRKRNFSWKTIGASKIQIKWFPKEDGCVLRIRSHKNLGSNIMMDVYVNEIY
ncbi:hypothetical protein LJC39_01720 [Parabacteroides sp. OttesenSCG-928-B22]|nr:hypothetical protein [Parabacteroides sp. OttesenSCG-928-B22]